MIKELVPLRFVLILMIFFHHAAGFAGGGWAAVAYFFVLSGFCMMLGYRDKVVNKDFSYRSYIKKRFLRIFPMHWVTLSVVLGLMLWNEHGLGNVRTLLVNALLLQSWIPDSGVYFSYNAVSWYLSTAMLAIVLFPMLTVFIERLVKHDKFIFIGLLMIAYCVIAFRMPNCERHAMLYIHPVARLMDFILGIYLAYVYLWLKDNTKLVTWVNNHGSLMDIGFILCFIVFVVIGVYSPDKLRSVAGVFWIPLSLSLLFLVLGQHSSTFMHRMLQTKQIRILTQCSFSLMMWHLIIIEQVSNITPPYTCEWLNTITQLAFSYTIAQISYFLIEKKLYDTSIGRL